MVKCDKSPVVPASLKVEKLKGENGSYLVDEVFNLRNTGMRVIKSAQRMKALQREMNIFFNELKRYQENKSETNKRRVVVRLKRSAAFAAFKRSYIRNKDEYAEFQEYVSLMK